MPFRLWEFFSVKCSRPFVLIQNNNFPGRQTFHFHSIYNDHSPADVLFAPVVMPVDGSHNNLFHNC